MRELNRRVLSVAAAALFAVPAYAATPNASSSAAAGTEASDAPTSAVQKTANSDFGKVSRDGAKAFDDIDLARLAIFNGQTAKAQQDVQQAEAMLTKAKSDETVFTKAESELKVPAGTAQRGPANATPKTEQIAWLPVSGMMVTDEDYIADKAKGAGVAQADAEADAQADAQVKQGDTKHALETLKLHDVDVSFVEQVAPLDATLKGVEQAANLMEQGHYFAANQALKTVDDGVRIDEQDYVAAPASKTASAAK
jgi:hypothetical protein